MMKGMGFADAAIFSTGSTQSSPHSSTTGSKTGDKPPTVTTPASVAIRIRGDYDGWNPPPPITLSDGTRLQLFKDGGALEGAYDAIRHARKRVCLETYIFADDETGNAFAELLCAKAGAGVATYVIYDSFGSCGARQMIKPKQKLLANMARAGVHIRQFNPIRPWECRFSWRPVNRDHRKLLFVDDDIGGLGGLNVARRWPGPWSVKRVDQADEHWRDDAVGVLGPSARPLLHAFARTWHYCTHGGRIARTELLHEIKTGEFGLLASAPTLDSPLGRFLCDLMNAARRQISLTMAYFVPNDDLVKAMTDAARRGVCVRLMLGTADIAPLVAAARSFYERLLAVGVEIYERNVIVHAKTMVIDGQITVIGSTNLDQRSIEYNCELSAIIRSPEFGAQREALFESDVRFAKHISPEEWRGRPLLDRFGQWAVSRLRYLL
jgi:cardiolipin synthase A/B